MTKQPAHRTTLIRRPAKDSMATIVEVGPRDGLQNETAPVPTAAKIAFVNALSESGVGEIEVSAFVSPRWVPQLGDAADVFSEIARHNGVVYSALVPNETGLKRAIESRVEKISVFTAASETFTRRNINTSIAGSIRRFRPVVEQARQEGLAVRGYVSTAFWCAFEGKIAPQTVCDVVERLADIGVDEMSISDTIGKATPDEVNELLDMLLPRFPADRIAMHFHDTYHRGVANVLASSARGIRIFDASAGGLGGCPYSPGATGNVSTESVVAALESSGISVGVDRRKLTEAGRILSPYLTEVARNVPDADSLACSACEYATDKTCCRRTD